MAAKPATSAPGEEIALGQALAIGSRSETAEARGFDDLIDPSGRVAAIAIRLLPVS